MVRVTSEDQDPKATARPRSHALAELAGIAFGAGVLTAAALALRPAGVEVAAFRPATGFLIGVLVVGPRGRTAGRLAAAAVGLMAALSLSHRPLLVDLGVTALAVAVALVTVEVQRRVARGARELETGRELVGLVAGAVAGAALCAVGTFAILTAWRSEPDDGQLAALQFAGQFVSALVVAPAVVAVWRRRRRSWSVPSATELVVQLTCFAVSSATVLLALGRLPLQIVPLSVLMWAAARFGLGIAVGEMLVFSGVAVGSFLASRGPFAGVVPHLTGLVSLEVWLALAAVIVNLVAVTMRERSKALDRSRELEGQLRHLALYDRLTGIPNRALFFDRLRQVVPGPDRDAGRPRAGVIYCDLDGFKAVNDAYGHAAGDAVLVATARRIRSAVRPGDTACRLGGDEFAVVCTGVSDVDQLAEVAERIRREVSRPISGRDDGADGLPTGVTVSVGASLGLAAARPGEGPEDVVQRADAAMYRAKSAGKNRVAVA